MDSWSLTQLGNIKEECKCIISNINLVSDISNRLKNLGIFPGVELLVIQSENNGPSLIEVNGNQIMLDWDTVNNIDVKVQN